MDEILGVMLSSGSFTLFCSARMDSFAAGGLAAAVKGRCDDWIHNSGLSRATVGAALHAAPAPKKKKKKVLAALT